MPAPTHPVPLRLGEEAEFSALRTALEAAGYTEAAVCSRLSMERLSEYRLEGPRHLDKEPDDPLGLLIWLLMEGATVSAANAAKLPVGELRALDIIAAVPASAERISATVMLYPVRGLMIASDRSRPMEEQTSPPPDDLVYPAIPATTERYLSLIEFPACDAFLDLCSGTGIAAMVAVRAGAHHAWAFDVTARSTHFAEFNRRLNAIPNLTAAQGDLYAPAESSALTFDCIAAHAPYVPVFRHNMVFDSGGQDGEQIVRGAIEGLPRYLRPGARFYAPLLGTDREKPFELRLREWLGAAEGEFDIAFVVDRAFTPSAYVAEAVSRNRAGVADVQPWRELLERMGVRKMARGSLIVQRRASARPVFTVRRQIGPRSGTREHHWIVNWETFAANGAPALLEMHPLAARSAVFLVEHRLSEEGWAPESYHLNVDYPFEMEVPVQPWAAHLLASANGSRTTAELLRILQDEAGVSRDAPPLEFAKIVAQLVSAGLLEVEGFRLPAPE